MVAEKGGVPEAEVVQNRQFITTATRLVLHGLRLNKFREDTDEGLVTFHCPRVAEHGRVVHWFALRRHEIICTHTQQHLHQPTGKVR